MNFQNVQGEISAIYGKISAIYSEISAIYGEISATYSEISAVYGEIWTEIPKPFVNQNYSYACISVQFFEQRLGKSTSYIELINIPTNRDYQFLVCLSVCIQ